MTTAAAPNTTSPPDQSTAASTAPASLIDRLHRPIDGSTLFTFRIVFGLLLTGEAIRYYGMRDSQFPWWEFHTYYQPLQFLQAWPRLDAGMVLIVIAVSAAMLCLGLFARVAATVFAVSYTYQFVLDPSHYNNHFYLIAMFGFWLIFLNGNSGWSVDAWLSPKCRRRTVPWWHIGILQFHLWVVYIYGSLAKINTDWLTAHPVRAWLAQDKDLPLVGPYLTHPAAAYFVAYFGLVFDLVLPFLLISRRTRWIGVVLALSFHGANHFLFDIGVFPFLGIASLIVFFEPDTPRRVVRAVARWFGSTDAAPPTDTTPEEPRFAPRAPGLVATVLGVYAALQILLPFRHFLYEGWVEWNCEAKNFAWRMMLSYTDPFLGMVVYDPDKDIAYEVDQQGHYQVQRGKPYGAGRELFTRPVGDSGLVIAMMVPEKLLRQRQKRGANGVWGHPRQLASYARYIASEARELGIENPQVYVDAIASLNGRPYQYRIDPNVDLANEYPSLWRTPEWIVPLEPDDGRERRYHPPNAVSKYEAVQEVLRTGQRALTRPPGGTRLMRRPRSGP